MSNPDTSGLVPVVPGHAPADTHCQDLPETIVRLVDGVKMLSNNHVDTPDAEVEHTVSESGVAGVGLTETSDDQDKALEEGMGDGTTESSIVPGKEAIQEDTVGIGVTKCSIDQNKGLVEDMGDGVTERCVASDRTTVEGAETTGTCGRITEEDVGCEKGTDTSAALDRAMLEKDTVAEGANETHVALDRAMAEKDAVAEGTTETSPDGATVLRSTETAIVPGTAKVQYNARVGPTDKSNTTARTELLSCSDCLYKCHTENEMVLHMIIHRDASDMAIVDGGVAAGTHCDGSDKAAKEDTVREEATETYVALDRAIIEKYIVAGVTETSVVSHSATVDDIVAKVAAETSVSPDRTPFEGDVVFGATVLRSTETSIVPSSATVEKDAVVGAAETHVTSGRTAIEEYAGAIEISDDSDSVTVDEDATTAKTSVSSNRATIEIESDAGLGTKETSVTSDKAPIEKGSVGFGVIVDKELNVVQAHKFVSIVKSRDHLRQFITDRITQNERDTNTKNVSSQDEDVQILSVVNASPSTDKPSEMANTNDPDRSSQDVQILSVVNASPSTDESTKTTGNELLSCSDCLYKCNTENEMILHMIIHRNFTHVRAIDEANDFRLKYRRYVCRHCMFMSSSRLMFREHVRCHTLAEPYLCAECGSCVDLKQVLKHFEVSHDHRIPSIRVNPSPHVDAIMQLLGPGPPRSGADIVKGAKLDYLARDPTDRPDVFIVDGVQRVGASCRTASETKKDNLRRLVAGCHYKNGGLFVCSVCSFSTGVASVMHKHILADIVCCKCDCPCCCCGVRNDCVVFTEAVSKLVEGMQATGISQRVAETLFWPTKKNHKLVEKINTSSYKPKALCKTTSATALPGKTVFVVPFINNPRFIQIQPMPFVSASSNAAHISVPDGGGRVTFPALKERPGSKPRRVICESIAAIAGVQPFQPIRPVTSEVAASGLVRKKRTLKLLFDFDGSTYMCRSCCISERDEVSFRMHLWQHVHQRDHCPHVCSALGMYNTDGCSIIDNVVHMLRTKEQANGAQTLASTTAAGSLSKADSRAAANESARHTSRSTAESESDEDYAWSEASICSDSEDGNDVIESTPDATTVGDKKPTRSAARAAMLKLDRSVQKTLSTSEDESGRSSHDADSDEDYACSGGEKTDAEKSGSGDHSSSSEAHASTESDSNNSSGGINIDNTNTRSMTLTRKMLGMKLQSKSRHESNATDKNQLNGRRDKAKGTKARRSRKKTSGKQRRKSAGRTAGEDRTTDVRTKQKADENWGVDESMERTAGEQQTSDGSTQRTVVQDISDDDNGIIESTTDEPIMQRIGEEDRTTNVSVHRTAEETQTTSGQERTTSTEDQTANGCAQVTSGEFQSTTERTPETAGDSNSGGHVTSDDNHACVDEGSDAEEGDDYKVVESASNLHLTEPANWCGVIIKSEGSSESTANETLNPEADQTSAVPVSIHRNMSSPVSEVEPSTGTDSLGSCMKVTSDLKELSGCAPLEPKHTDGSPVNHDLEKSLTDPTSDTNECNASLDSDGCEGFPDADSSDPDDAETLGFAIPLVKKENFADSDLNGSADSVNDSMIYGVGARKDDRPEPDVNKNLITEATSSNKDIVSVETTSSNLNGEKTLGSVIPLVMKENSADSDLNGSTNSMTHGISTKTDDLPVPDVGNNTEATSSNKDVASVGPTSSHKSSGEVTLKKLKKRTNKKLASVGMNSSDQSTGDGIKLRRKKRRTKKVVASVLLSSSDESSENEIVVRRMKRGSNKVVSSSGASSSDDITLGEMRKQTSEVVILISSDNRSCDEITLGELSKRTNKRDKKSSESVNARSRSGHPPKEAASVTKTIQKKTKIDNHSPESAILKVKARRRKGHPPNVYAKDAASVTEDIQKQTKTGASKIINNRKSIGGNGSSTKPLEPKPNNHEERNDADKEGGGKESETGEDEEGFFYKCNLPVCGRSFCEAKELKEHIQKSHASMSMFPCPYCACIWSDYCRLIEHIPSHIGSKPYRCIQCDVAFKTSASLRKHFQTSHRVNRPFACTTDGCEFVSNLWTEFKVHNLNYHGGEKRHACFACDARFANLSDYFSHVESGMETMVCCSLCKMKSKIPHTILRHVRCVHHAAKGEVFVQTTVKCVHTDEATVPQTNDPKPSKETVHVCDQCDFADGNRVSFDNHTESHQVSRGIRLSFSCQLCPFGSDDRTQYKLHIANHRGTPVHQLRSFKCTHCDFITNQMPVIENHLQERHSDRPFNFEVQQEVVPANVKDKSTGSDVGQTGSNDATQPSEQLEKSGKSPTSASPCTVPEKDPARSSVSKTNPGKANRRSRTRRSCSDDDDDDFTVAINHRPVKKKRKNAKKTEVASAVDTDGRTELRRSSRVSVTRTGEAEIIDCSSSDGLDVEQPSIQAGGAVETTDAVIDRFHCDLCEFAGNDLQLFDDHMSLLHGNHNQSRAINTSITRNAEASKIKSENTVCEGTTGSNAIDTGSTVEERHNYQCKLCDVVYHTWQHFKTHMEVEHSYRVIKTDEAFPIQNIIAIPIVTPPAAGVAEERIAPTISPRAAESPSQMNARSGSQTCDVLYAANRDLSDADLKKSHSDDGDYRDDTNVDQTIGDDMDDDEHPGDDDRNDEETIADKSSYCTRNDLNMERDSATRHCSSDDSDAVVDCDTNTSEIAATSRSINNEDLGTGNMPDGVDQSWWRRYATQANNNNKFFCSLCSKYRQSSASQLKRHISSAHFGFKPFACKYCDFSSMETRYLKIHIKKGHPGLAFDFVQRKYPARDCAVDLAVPRSDVGHNAETRAGKSRYCTHNDLGMDNDSLTRRSSSDHGDRQAPVIEVDGDAMTSETAMTSRRINTEDVGTGDMPDGDDQSWWQRYIKLESNNMFHCSLCKYQESSMRRLKRHISAVHLGFKPFACKYCNFSSVETWHLKIHITKTHPGLAFDFVQHKYPERDCAVDSSMPRSDVGHRSTAVGRRGASQGALSTKQTDAIAIGKRHLRSESGLTETRLAHVGFKSFKCKYCDFSAMDTRYVRVHIKKTHPGLAFGFVRCKYSERDCDVHKAVGAVIMGSDNDEAKTRDRPDGDDQSWWRCYVKLDNGQKFCCTLCKHTQTLMSALKRHISAVHLGFKPFACKHCDDFSAVSTRDVRLHIKRRHPGLAFGFVRRKYCDVRSSSVAHTSTAVGRPNTLQGALSTEQADTTAMGESDSGLTDTDTPRKETFTGIKKRCTIEQTLEVKPEALFSDPPALNVNQRIKFYKCIYCEFCSEDRLSDVRDHIFVSHLHRNRFSCVHCAFGSMTKGDVTAHCLTNHPGKVQKLNEDKGHSRSITILETHGDVRLVGMLSSDNVPLIELPTNLRDETPERIEIGVVETSGVSRLAACDTSGGETTLPSTTSTSSRTNVRQNNAYSCMKCDFSSERRCLVRKHMAYLHLGMKRFGCPYCAVEHSLSNSLRNHVKTSHPGKKVHCINPMMQKLKLINSHIIVTRIQQGVDATTVSDMPKQQRRKRQGNGSGLELRTNVRMETRFGNRSATTPDAESAIDDTSEDGKRTKSHSSSNDTPDSNILWKCTTCGMKLAMFKAMTDHVLTSHMSLQPYQCAVCDFGACSNDLVQTHIQEAHPHSRIDIPVVDVVAEKADCLKTKMIRVRVKKAIVPPAETVKKAIVPPVGTVKKATVPPVETDSCGTFDYAQLCTVGTNGKLVYRCDLCDHEVNRMYNIIIHRESHDRRLSLFGCSYCAYKVNRKLHMEKHIKKLHTGWAMKYHIIPKGGSVMRHEGANQKTLAQSNCETTVLDSDDRRLSLFGCSYCAYKSNRKLNIERHIKKIHTGRAMKYHLIPKGGSLMRHDGPNQKTLAQSNCETAVLDSDGQTLSKKTPPQKSTVSVTTCAVACGSESVVLSSEDGAGMNDGEKPMFACLMCGVKNVLRASVRDHILYAHLKFRPFPCSYCMHSSTSRRGIHDHITRNHPGEPCSIAHNSQKRLEEIADANIVQAMNTDVTMPSEGNPNDSVKLPEERPMETSRQISTDDSDKPAETKESPTTNETYLCVLCKTYTTVSKVAMLRHIAIEIDYLPFMCPHCPFIASRQDTVRTHIKIAHPNLAVCVLINKDEAKERRAVELLETSVVARHLDAFSKQLSGESIGNTSGCKRTIVKEERRSVSPVHTKVQRTGPQRPGPGPQSRRPGPQSRRPGPQSRRPGPQSRQPVPQSRGVSLTRGEVTLQPSVLLTNVRKLSPADLNSLLRKQNCGHVSVVF